MILSRFYLTLFKNITIYKLPLDYTVTLYYNEDMKKIFTLLFAITTLFIMNASFASAQYYSDYTPYNNNYVYGSAYNNNYYNPYQYQTGYVSPYNNTSYNYNNSYQYMQGCDIYMYNGYTGRSTLIGSRCNNYQNNYQNQYQYYSPNQNQYGTYQYSNSNWTYGSNCNNNNYSGYNYGYNNNYNCNNYNNNQNNNCYYQNGYYICY